MFLVKPSQLAGRTATQDTLQTLLSATYSCPWEKTSSCKNRPTKWSVWPWALFVVMVKHGWTGNWHHFSVKGKSVSDGTNVMQGSSTHVPLFTPLQISASMMQFPRYLIIICVPLWSPFPGPALKLRRRITGQLTLSCIECGGSPDKFRKFRNSTGYVLSRPSSPTESAEV